MGHRGNYFIKKEGKIKTFYTHWRGNMIAKDLLVGADSFIDFVYEFDEGNIVEYPWIQGFVYLDLDNKEMYFNEMTWLSFTSVKRYYLDVLRTKWEGWKIDYAAEGLYLVEREVQKGYIEAHPVDYSGIEVEYEEGQVDFFCTGTIYINEAGRIKVNYLNTDTVAVLLPGPKVFKVLDAKKGDKIMPEHKQKNMTTVLIDVPNKRIAFSEGMPRLLEEVQFRWPGWTVEVVELGYLNLLEEAGIDTTDIKMTDKKILKAIKKMLDHKDDFDPQKIANTLFAGLEAGLNPKFFENIKPSGPGEKAPVD